MITRALFACSLSLITAARSIDQDEPHYLSRKLVNPPCLESCDENGSITAEILQKCVEKCSSVDYCCGNRLVTTDGEDSSNSFLSCANGCEIAYYSTTVEECKEHCQMGNEAKWCIYDHPLTDRFKKCGECASCNESTEVGSTDCRDGCIKASFLDDFYAYDVNVCSGTEDIPRFLFAGQSNMEGYTEGARQGLFLELVNTLTAKGSRKEKVRKMKNYLKMANGSTQRSSLREANLMFKLGRYIRKNNFSTDNYEKAVCSWTRPGITFRLDCERSLSPTACGKNFGPELMFGHVFPRKKSPLKGKRIGIIKIARGGTQIKRHWMKEYSSNWDNYWQHLVDGITAANGSIEAFVWFQGENDSFDDTNKEEYLDNLTTFVADVRNEIFQSSTKFQTPSDVPVVIIEMGVWIYGIDTAVIDAQRTFVENTVNTVLVNTGANDNERKRLSDYYHYNAATQMIIGDRIARALAKLMNQP